MTTISRRLADRVTPLRPVDTGLEPVGVLSEKPAAWLFDVYGTLLISASGDISDNGGPGTPDRALAVLLEQYSISRPPEDLCRALTEEIKTTHSQMKENGIDYPEVDIRRVWQTVLGSDDLDMIRRFAAEFEMVVNPVYPMPRAEALLTAIRKKNIPAGIISNAQFYTQYLFKVFFDDFPQNAWADPELILYSFEYGHGKPSPRLFEKAAETLTRKGITVSNTLYIGNDMLKDIRPAAALGFKTALFAGDARSLRLRQDEPSCREIRPDLVITALSQLEQYI